MKNDAVAVQSILEAAESLDQRLLVLGGRKVQPSRFMNSRLCLFIVLLLALPSGLWAEDGKGSWSDLNRLRRGQGIEVIGPRMQRHAGKFISVTDESLTLQEGGSDLSIKREDIVRVSTSSGPRRGEHAVIGLVIGGGIGAAIGALAGSSHGFLGGSDKGIAALVGIAIGAPAGALVGAAIPAHTTVYRAVPPDPHQTTPSTD